MSNAPVEFLLSAMSRAQWPPDPLPEIAFAGRSNVGKSSCLNALVGSKRVARVSKTPGRTQAINFFAIRRAQLRMRFADLPGYGFAKVPAAVRGKWEQLVGDYLSQRDDLALVVVLVDIRRDPTALDKQMIQWLRDSGRTGLLVLTKCDKLSRNKRMTQRRAICKGLGVPSDAAMLFSSLDRTGRDELWKRIEEVARSF